MRRMSGRSRGFTLVELVVVTPLIIILIGSMVVISLQASQSALRAYAKAKLQNDVLLALDMMEQDVKLSTHISTVFSNRIAMDNFATNINPYDPNRQLVNSSNCQLLASGASPDIATVYRLDYLVLGRSLVRWSDFTGKWCGGSQAAQGSSVWQKHGLTETIIPDADITLTVGSFVMVPERNSSASAMQVEIVAKRQVAGQEISFTGRAYLKSSNVGGI